MKKEKDRHSVPDQFKRLKINKIYNLPKKNIYFIFFIKKACEKNVNKIYTAVYQILTYFQEGPLSPNPFQKT